MKKLNILLAVVMSVAVVFSADAAKKKKADKDTNQFRYEIEYSKTGGNGMQMVKVWSYSKKPRIALEQCKKNAVHGILFKGYTTAETGGISQRPLLKDADVLNQYKEFFDEFFADGGPYMKYVSAVADGSTTVRKVGKEYKTGVVVTVNKEQLREDMEAAGMIKGLTTGF
jgi:hypothetical protein